MRESKFTRPSQAWPVLKDRIEKLGYDRMSSTRICQRLLINYASLKCKLDMHAEGVFAPWRRKARTRN